jgi:large subunit ribosomal protein L32e
VAYIKPKLTENEKRLLKIKNKSAVKRVEFKRQEWFRYKKLGDSWRKPRGKHSKQREHLARRPPVVDAGYRSPSAVRGLHPSGFQEVLVFTPQEIEKLDPLREAARIGSSVGSRKRELIMEKAEELKVRILNPEVE